MEIRKAHLTRDRVLTRIHKKQRVQHVVANKVQLALTILKELESERAVEPRLIKRAVRDLEAIVSYVNERAKA